MSRPRALVATVVLLALALTGCSKSGDGQSAAQLPAGSALVSDAAAKTRALKSAHIKIEAEGEVGGLPVRRAEGDLLRSGDAKGSILLSQLGVLVQYDFIVIGKDIWLKGVTGGYQKVDAAVAAAIYDPSAILDPDRGIAKVLATATNPVTEAKEPINGKDAYRVSVGLDSKAVSALVPNVGDGVTGKLWIDADTKDMVKAVLTIPGTNGGKGGTVTITETNIDVAVTVSAP